MVFTHEGRRIGLPLRIGDIMDESEIKYKKFLIEHIRELDSILARIHEA